MPCCTEELHINNGRADNDYILHSSDWFATIKPPDFDKHASDWRETLPVCLLAPGFLELGLLI